jgi:hypothetical protein
MFEPITTLVSTNISVDHCVVCPFSIYDFRLLFWYLQTFLLTIVLSVLFLFTTKNGPTTQWSKEKFEDTKIVIGSRK